MPLAVPANVTNSYDQEVIANAHPLRMRGLQAFRFAGAMRTLAQLLRRALNFVLDVTSTLGKDSSGPDLTDAAL